MASKYPTPWNARVNIVTSTSGSDVHRLVKTPTYARNAPIPASTRAALYQDRCFDHHSVADTSRRAILDPRPSASTTCHSAASNRGSEATEVIVRCNDRLAGI